MFVFMILVEPKSEETEASQEECIAQVIMMMMCQPDDGVYQGLWLVAGSLVGCAFNILF